MALSKVNRLKLIDRLGENFAPKSFVMIDAALEAFGASGPINWDGDDKYGYVVFSLKDASDEAILGLAEYAGLPDEPPSATTMEKKNQRKFKKFRLFISHVSAHKDVASELSNELSHFSIDGFVAHEDIKPTVEWQVEIEKRLSLCDALAALLHENFKLSQWTDQEIGWVLGRHKPVIAIKYDEAPYGFFGKSQAFSGNGKSSAKLAREIFRRLAEHADSREAISHAVVGGFYASSSFNDANSRAALLLLLKYWDDELRQKVEAAVSDNYEVTHAFDVPAVIEALKASWGASGSIAN